MYVPIPESDVKSNDRRDIAYQETFNLPYTHTPLMSEPSALPREPPRVKIDQVRKNKAEGERQNFILANRETQSLPIHHRLSSNLNEATRLEDVRSIAYLAREEKFRKRDDEYQQMLRQVGRAAASAEKAYPVEDIYRGTPVTDSRQPQQVCEVSRNPEQSSQLKTEIQPAKNLEVLVNQDLDQRKAVLYDRLAQIMK